MKLKLLIGGIIIIVSLVAYQKYSEYSDLKSIDSYNSCITAKGSVIQESYPSTCVTRLGASLTKTIPPLNSQEIPQITEKEINQGWYWGGSDQKKFNMPTNWVFTDNGKSSCWHNPNTTCEQTFEKSCGICPQLMSPAPDFCADGKIIQGKVDECGCYLGPECLNQLKK
mgnify:CR=1 FL=1